jgi:polysaccharide biosynthesis protein PslG
MFPQRIVSPEVDAELTKRVGANVVRVSFDWRWAEPQKDQYGFTPYDQIYNAMLAKGVRPMFTLLFSPWWTWDEGVTCDQWREDCTYPPAPEHYAELQEIAGMLAKRYPQAAGIEIWNEPNLTWFWKPRPDPRRYTELLKQAYRGIKAANPAMPVAAGGFSNNQVTADGHISLADFTRAVYENGGKDYMDAIAFHPYPWALDDQKVLKSFADVRGVREAFGDGQKPLWVTETGVSTTGTDSRFVFSEQQQADRLVSLYRTIKAMPDVGMIFIHTLIESGTDPLNFGVGYGVLHRDLRPKPAYCALARERASGYTCPLG